MDQTAASLSGLPSMDEVWNWHEQLAEMGPRYTGSPSHACFIEWLKEQFSAVPRFQLRTDPLTFHRWLAQDWSLFINQDATVGASGPVPVTYYYPFSGTTGPKGITCKLVDLGMYTPGWSTPALPSRSLS